MGEGAGLLVMESLEHALARGARIHAEYMGGAITCDAHHMTDPRADGLGVSTCIELAIKDAGISVEDINYINAHATSTLVGDVAEIAAVRKVFKDMTNVKMNALGLQGVWKQLLPLWLSKQAGYIRVLIRMNARKWLQVLIRVLILKRSIK